MASSPRVSEQLSEKSVPTRQRGESTIKLSKNETRRDSLNPLSNYTDVRREDILRHVFGDVGDLLDDFSCAVESTVLLHGRMYVTTQFLCFYSNLFGLEKKIRIPYTHITAVAKENTALVIPNAIAITTIRKEYVFRSFWDRDECFKMLKDHIRGMAHKGVGVHERGTKIKGYSVKNVDQESKSSHDASASFKGERAQVFDDNDRDSRARARSDMSRPSDSGNSADFSPSLPGSPQSSTRSNPSPSNRSEPAGLRKRAATAGQVDTSPGRRHRGEQTSEEDPAKEANSSDDEYNFMDNSDEEEEDIVEETAWTDKDKEGAVTCQEDGTGDFTLEDVMQEFSRAGLKNHVLKETLPVSVQDFAKMFVEDPAQHSWKEFHHKMGDSQLDVTNWSNMRAAEHENLGSGREIKFFKPVNLPGLKETRGVKLQKYQRFGTVGLIVHSSTRLEDVPAADTFTVEDVVTVRKPKPDECSGDVNAHSVVEISFEVRFIKSTFLKYMIESNTNTEMKKWLEKFFDHVRGIVAEHVGKAEQKLDSIKKILDVHSGGQDEGDPAMAAKSIRRMSLKVTEHAVGFQGHFAEAIESWQRVEGRRFFVVCFALLLFMSIALYWQLRHVQTSLDHLHDSVEAMSKEIAELRAAQPHKRR